MPGYLGRIFMQIEGYGVELVTISQDKIEKIRGWRNHPEIKEVMLNKQEISKAEQQLWFDSLTDRKDCLYLLIRYKQQDIGVISALSVNIDTQHKLPLKQAKNIAPGLYIAPDCKYKNSVLAFSPSLLFIEYLFQQGCCEKLTAQVYHTNEQAIRYNKMLGYQVQQQDEQGFLTMTLTQAQFNKAKPALTNILRF